MKWSAIRILGFSMPARVAVVLPFLGYFLVYNDTVLNLFSKTDDMRILIEVSRIHFTFFGMVFFGIGSLSCYLLCPSEIRQAGSFSEFVEIHEKFNTSETTKALYINAIENYKNTIIEKFTRAYREVPAYASLTLSREVIGRITHEFRIDLYHIIYNAANECRPVARYFIIVLFGLGISFMLVPTIMIATALLLK